jgi:hypothetical protein
LHPAAIFAISLTIWIVASYAVLRPFGRTQFVDRLPFVLTITNLALELALMEMPKAFPGLFDWLLGHSIYAHRFETDWQWINRWEMGVASDFRLLVILGAIWGVVNLFRRRSVVLNSLAVVGALILLVWETHMGL